MVVWGEPLNPPPPLTGGAPEHGAVSPKTLNLLKPLPASPQVELLNTVPSRLKVLGDSGRILQILNNLLGNAGEWVGWVGWVGCGTEELRL